MNRLELKIEALKQSIAKLTVEYEDRDAERRVEITELSEANQNLEQQVNDLKTELEALREVPQTEEGNTEVEGDSTGYVPED